MNWLAALIKGILDWLSGEVKKDTKAGDADKTSDDLKSKWRKRIEATEMEVGKRLKEPVPEEPVPEEPAPKKPVSGASPTLDHPPEKKLYRGWDNFGD
jgi:hypothetical protein